MPNLRMRRDVAGMTISTPPLSDYNNAVGIMKTRFPTSDARSWEGQARIHLDNCPHGNWFFLPWHRAYVLAFENLIRDILQKPDFGLPYWNWTKDPRIPGPFFQGNLVDNTRIRGPNDVLPPSYVGQPVIDDIMRQTDFELFASFKPIGQNSLERRWQRASGAKALLERTPHDQTHVWVNGNMVTMMSPLDPIFWLHHCNIDRLWAQWNALGRRDTTDTLWVEFPFSGNFVNSQGQSISYTVSGLRDVTRLGYTYDTLPQQQPTFAVAAAAALDAIAERPSLLERARTRYVARAPRAAGLGETADFTVETERSAVPLAAAAAAAADQLETEAAPEESKVVAIIQDVSPPKDPRVTVNIFLSCPYASADTPTTDPHYVGNFTFFGVHGDEEGGDHGEHHHHGHEGHPSTQDFAYDITDTVARLRALEPDLDSKLTLQLVPVPHPGVDVGQVEVKFGAVEILYV
ncbi:MAG TPA: tyrosinase family protein [Longimicrobium sp.]|nr:tyrosinase family protein [Longimicrobium sp.]